MYYVTMGIYYISLHILDTESTQQGHSNPTVQFLARHEVGTLAKALQVFIVSD